MAASGAPSELDSRPQSRREWSGYLRSLVLPLAILVAIIGGLLYLQSRGGNEAEAGFGTVALPEAKNPTGMDASPVTGRAAPDFLLRTLDGQTLRLSDLQGRPVILNFWASWCAPCREETPSLIAAYETNSKQNGLVVVGVNLRESQDRAGAFADDFGVPYPIAFDTTGQVARTWRIGGPTSGLPSSYFIDAHGVVQKVVYGTVTDKLLAEGLTLITKAGQ